MHEHTTFNRPHCEILEVKCLLKTAMYMLVPLPVHHRALTNKLMRYNALPVQNTINSFLFE